MSQPNRWRLPPLRAGQVHRADEPTPPVAGARLDERLVRTMLKVNSGLRQGRTTMEVKRHLERGGSLSSSDTSAAATAGIDGEAVQDSPTQGQESSSRTQLAETIESFIGGQRQVLARAHQDLSRRRQELDEEARQLDTRIRHALITFIGLLDESAVHHHGPGCLAVHHAFLAQVRLPPGDLLRAAHNSRTSAA